MHTTDPFQHMSFDPSRDKMDVVKELKDIFQQLEFEIVEDMTDKPWGAGYRFSDDNLKKYLDIFFKGEGYKAIEGQSLSPKILLLAPESRLSWQYHSRRTEIWKNVGGQVGYMVSDTDEESDVRKLLLGEITEVSVTTRHRLIGLKTYGLVAEIWQHADKSKPSDELDNVRLADDFGREGTNKV